MGSDENRSSTGNQPRVRLDKQTASAATIAPPPSRPLSAPPDEPVAHRRRSRPRPAPLIAVVTVAILAVLGWMLLRSVDQTQEAAPPGGTSPTTARDESVDRGQVNSIPEFVGTWSGVVTQFDDDPEVDFPMTLALEADSDELTGSTTYELADGRCSGRLEFLSGDGSTVELRERISDGDCVGTGDITVELIDSDSVSFEYRATKKNGAAQLVRGVLAR